MSRSSTSSSEGPPSAVHPDPVANPSAAVVATRGQRALAWGVIAFFLAVLFGCGLVDLFAPLPAPKLIGLEKAVQDLRDAEARFGDGTLAKRIEERMRRTSRVRRTSMAFYSPLLLHLFDEAGNNYVSGPNGVLFLRNRIAVARPRDTIVGLAAGRIAAVANYLGAQGVRTVAMPLPRKSVVLAGELPPRICPHREYDEQLVTRLRELGVETVDLLPIYAADAGEPIYLAGDTHWSSQGTLLAARAVAAAILGDQPLHEPDLVSNPLGDNTRMIAHALGLDPMAERFLPSIPARQHYFRKPDQHRTVAEPPTSGPTPLLLAGTSFSKNATGTDTLFPQLLSAMLQCEVWNGASAGVTTLQSLTDSLADLGGRPLPPTVVLEMPNHYSLCTELPLSEIGDLFRLRPAPASYRSMLGDDPDHFRAPPLSSTEPLQAGATVSTPMLPSFARIPWFTFVYPRDGTLIVVLRGQVTGDQVEVAADYGTSKVFSTWTSTAREMVIPIAGAHLGVALDVSALVKTPGSQLTLESIDIRCNLDLDHGLAAAAGPAGPAVADGFRQTLVFADAPAIANAYVGIQIECAAGPQQTRQVDAVFADGSTARLFGPQPLEPSARLLLPLGSTARALSSIEVTGTGPAPTAPIRAWHLQRRGN